VHNELADYGEADQQDDGNDILLRLNLEVGLFTPMPHML
jgi:hypothetical protein